MNTPIIVAGAAGRMGSLIARLSQEFEGFELAGVLDRPDMQEKLREFSNIPASDNLSSLLSLRSDAVVIDFTTPDATMEHARIAAAADAPIVIGTTGLSEAQLAELESLAAKHLIFRTANMSVGINVLLEILPKLTAMLGNDYDVEISEIHHNKKKDAPSGTALLLADPILKSRGLSREAVQTNRFDLREPRKKDEIGMQSIRGGDVAGVHTVYFIGEGERIEVTHHAHSRQNFASGALRAAKWIPSQKPGRLYSMQDLLRSKMDK